MTATPEKLPSFSNILPPPLAAALLQQEAVRATLCQHKAFPQQRPLLLPLGPAATVSATLYFPAPSANSTSQALENSFPNKNIQTKPTNPPIRAPLKKRKNDTAACRRKKAREAAKDFRQQQKKKLSQLQDVIDLKNKELEEKERENRMLKHENQLLREQVNYMRILVSDIHALSSS